MTIRQRIEEVILLSQAGFHDPAFIIALVAVAGAARRKYPRTMINPRTAKKYTDSDAFKTYLFERDTAESPWNIRPLQPKSVIYRLNMPVSGNKTVVGIFYEEVRCVVIHEADIPSIVRLQPGEALLSIDHTKDTVTFGIGWIDLLIDIVVNDPDLRPMFDDIRRKTARDLTYVGSVPEEQFADKLVADFGSSLDRIGMVRVLIAKLGSAKARQMPDQDLQETWRLLPPSGLRLLDHPNLSLARDAQYANTEPFLRVSNHRQYEITDTGIRMLRILLDHYRSLDAGAVLNSRSTTESGLAFCL